MPDLGVGVSRHCYPVLYRSFHSRVQIQFSSLVGLGVGTVDRWELVACPVTFDLAAYYASAQFLFLYLLRRLEKLWAGGTWDDSTACFSCSALRGSICLVANVGWDYE